MTFDSYTVENDPFLIELRVQLNALEFIKDETYKASDAAPRNVAARVTYDAALMRWAHAKVDYERALKAAIGL